jgi:hypothetical protein
LREAAGARRTRWRSTGSISDHVIARVRHVPPIHRELRCASASIRRHDARGTHSRTSTTSRTRPTSVHIALARGLDASLRARRTVRGRTQVRAAKREAAWKARAIRAALHGRKRGCHACARERTVRVFAEVEETFLRDRVRHLRPPSLHTREVAAGRRYAGSGRHAVHRSLQEKTRPNRGCQSIFYELRRASAFIRRHNVRELHHIMLGLCSRSPAFVKLALAFVILRSARRAERRVPPRPDSFRPSAKRDDLSRGTWLACLS